MQPSMVNSSTRWKVTFQLDCLTETLQFWGDLGEQPSVEVCRPKNLCNQLSSCHRQVAFKRFLNGLGLLPSRRVYVLLCLEYRATLCNCVLSQLKHQYGHFLNLNLFHP